MQKRWVNIRNTFLTAVAFFAVSMPFRELFNVMEVTEMRPASALPPVFGLMLGLPGAVGCAIGNLAADILSGYGFAICAPGFAAQFIYGALPLLLWNILKRHDAEKPDFFRLNNVKNVIRYIGIILVSSVAMAAMLGGIIQMLNISPFFSSATLMFFFNNFVFSMVLGIPLVIFMSFQKLKAKGSGLALNERFVLMFLTLGVVSAILLGVFAYAELSRIIDDPLTMWNTIYTYIAVNIFIFNLITVVFLWYSEKNITVPVELISEIAQNYISDDNEKESSAAIAARCAAIAKNTSETGVLAEAFRTMILDLETYISNLMKVTAEKERIGAELDVATKIQASMLPSIFPAFPERPEFDIYASMQPAKEVGGDFYDMFLLDGNTLAIVMADVSGKGVPAALFMVIAKTLIKNNAQSGKSPKEVFEAVNNILCENNDAGMFVTAILGYFDIPTGRFTFVNAGHNPPLLRSGQNLFNWLKTKPDFILAGMDNISYKQHEVLLSPGDELFLYTDGVTEAVNNQDELFSDPRLLETANQLGSDSQERLSLQEFTVSIKREIDIFAEGAEQADDITMLALRYIGGTRRE
ncbi:MAG: PP2C family protein-serine/threonine phosphatase [Oscillospiraceae bacterium]|nr:PP2C family protein-serine/threonine phosphatase [Oscillospiraceae bacterium]